MAPRAPVNRLSSQVCTPALGSSFIPARPEDGEGRGGVQDKSNLPVIAPAYSAGSTVKNHQMLRLQAHVSHLLKQCLEERCSGESFKILFSLAIHNGSPDENGKTAGVSSLQKCTRSS